MLRNELLLCNKILTGNLPPKEIIQFHTYSYPSNFQANEPKSAYRKVVVYKKSSGLGFKYITGASLSDEKSFTDAFTLQYKNCPSDTSSKRFYFGDLYIPVKKLQDKKKFLKSVKPPEPQNPLAQVVLDFYHAFYNSFDDFWAFLLHGHEGIQEDPSLERFNAKKEQKKGSNPLKNYLGLYIHFDFSELIGSTHWYDLKGVIESLDNNEINLIKKDTFIYHQEIKGYSLLKKLIHTVGSGDEKNDNQFPGFDMSMRYKTFCTEENQLRTLFYYTKVLKACNILIPKSWPCFFRLIPIGDFSAKEALDYFKLIKTVKQRDLNEENLRTAEGNIQVPEEGSEDTLAVFGDPNTQFANASENCAKGIFSFNLILVRYENIDSNLGEINNLDRSTLRRVTKSIADKISDVKKEMKVSDKFTVTVAESFYDLHPNAEKFQVRCAHMMLKLYRDAYYGDPDLEKTFIERVLSDIRKDGDLRQYRNHLRSYIVLKRIAKNKTMMFTKEELENTDLKRIAKEKAMILSEKELENEQKSYTIGKLLALICWYLHFHINSFSRAHVGNMHLKILAINPLASVEKLLVQYVTTIQRHVGEPAGTETVKLNEVALNEINELINEFKSTGRNFIKISFLRGFLDEYNRELFIAQKPKSK